MKCFSLFTVWCSANTHLTSIRQFIAFLERYAQEALPRAFSLLCLGCIYTTMSMNNVHIVRVYCLGSVCADSAVCSTHSLSQSHCCCCSLGGGGVIIRWRIESMQMVNQEPYKRRTAPTILERILSQSYLNFGYTFYTWKFSVEKAYFYHPTSIIQVHSGREMVKWKSIFVSFHL